MIEKLDVPNITIDIQSNEALFDLILQSIYKINQTVDCLKLLSTPPKLPNSFTEEEIRIASELCKEVTIKCPDCFEGLYRVTKPGGYVPAGQCKTCDGTGIQQTGLTADQARLALDEGWVVHKEISKQPDMYVKIKNKYIYHYDGCGSTEDNDITNMRTDDLYKIKCRAVETKENLSDFEAIRSMIYEFEIDAGGILIYRMVNDVIECKRKDDNKWRRATVIDTNQTWTATKYNYPIPEVTT